MVSQAMHAINNNTSWLPTTSINLHIVPASSMNSETEKKTNQKFVKMSHLIVAAFTSTSPHCSLPETTEEYPTFIFGYNVEDASELYTIKEALEGYTDNSTDIQSVMVAEHVNIITFKMNRAAYLKACTNPAVKYAVYDGGFQGVITANTVQLPTATATQKIAQPTVVDVDTCQDVTAVKDCQTYSMEIISPKSLVDKQARCEKRKRQLERRNGIKGFWSYTCRQSCETDGDTVTLHARLNGMSLTYMCNKSELNFPVPPEPHSHLEYLFHVKYTIYDNELHDMGELY